MKKWKYYWFQSYNLILFCCFFFMGFRYSWYIQIYLYKWIYYRILNFSPPITIPIAVSCLNKIHSLASNHKNISYLLLNRLPFKMDVILVLCLTWYYKIILSNENMGYTFIMILNHNNINFWFYINNHFFYFMILKWKRWSIQKGWKEKNIFWYIAIYILINVILHVRMHLIFSFFLLIYYFCILFYLE